MSRALPPLGRGLRAVAFTRRPGVSRGSRPTAGRRGVSGRGRPRRGAARVERSGGPDVPQLLRAGRGLRRRTRAGKSRRLHALWSILGHFGDDFDPRAQVANCGHLLCAECNERDCACGARSVFRPRQPCPLICRAAGIAAPPAGAPRFSALEAPAPERADADAIPDYVHFGVGCDGCGVFPIRGTAYRCLDCPDAMGFDLCGACKASPRLAAAAGRFDQAHRPDHRVEERDQVTRPASELSLFPRRRRHEARPG